MHFCIFLCTSNALLSEIGALKAACHPTKCNIMIDHIKCLFDYLYQMENSAKFQKSTDLAMYTVKPVLSGHSKIDKTKILMTNGSLMKVEVLQNAPLGGAFCSIFDLHLAIIGLENQFFDFLRVAVLDSFYCILYAKQAVRQWFQNCFHSISCMCRNTLK